MIPIADQLKCAERELGIRRKVYPGWVKRKRMTFQEAARETEHMEAVVMTLTGVQEITNFIDDHITQEKLTTEQLDQLCAMMIKLTGLDLGEGKDG